MNILFLSPDYPSEGRNVSVFVKQLVDEFARLGHSIEVVAPYSITRNKKICNREEFYEIGKGRVRVIRPHYASFSNIKIHGKLLFDWLIKRAFCRGIHRTKLKHDIVYGHFWPSAFCGYDYARKNNMPLFVATGESRIRFRADSKEKKKFCDYVSGVICVSSKNRNESIELKLTTEEKCLVAPNATNVDVFRLLDKENCRIELGLPLDVFIVAFVGAFIHRKGTLRLSKAISLFDDNQKVFSLFIGEGPESPTCNGILFQGTVPHEKIPIYLNAADVFVLPTLHEGCCNAVIEAMACGLPVISSDLLFNLDVLNKSNSILVNPNDVEGIANAIRVLKDNKEKRKELALGAVKMAESLSINKRAQIILSFIDSKLNLNIK